MEYHDAPLKQRRRFYRRWPAMIAGIVTVALIGGLAFAGTVYLQRNTVTPVTYSAVRDRLAIRTPPMAEPVVAAARSQTSEPAPVTTPGPTPDHVVTTDTPSRQLPEEGIYRYRAEGREGSPTFRAERVYPSRVYASIEHLGGCGWRARIDVMEEHVDQIDVCTTDSIDMLAQYRAVTFLTRTTEVSFSCEPPHVIHGPDHESGHRQTSVCVGDDVRVELNQSYLGEVDSPTGTGTALRFRIESVLSGGTRGWSNDDMWIEPLTGTAHRWDREVELESVQFGQTVQYWEEASFILDTLEPIRG